MLKIEGKGKTNWTRDDGVIIDWTNYVVKYKDNRVRPSFLAPEVIQDSWNGKETDIQHVRYDGKIIEITAKESETDFISYLKSFDEIIITDYDVNESGTIINQTYTVDLTKSDNFEISEEENIGQTSGASYIFKFRTNRTVINKCLPVNNTNTLSLQKSTQAWELFKLAEIDTAYGKITKLSDNSVAYLDGDYLYKFNIINNEFVQEGARLNIPSISGIYDITSLDDSSVCVIYNAQGYLQKYTFSNNAWSITGNVLNIFGTVAAPVICNLYTSRIILYDSSLSELRAYDFDGTDWASVGTPFGILVTDYDLCRMTSTRFAFTSANGNFLRSYDFDGSNFTQDQHLLINSMSGVSITRLSNSKVAILDGGTEDLRSYELTASWAELTGSIIIRSTTPVCESLTEDKVFVHNSSVDGFYVYGVFDYYSDYDVIDYSEQTEPIKIDWPDGNSKTVRTIDKKGESILLYMQTSDYDDFITHLKTTSSYYINDTLATEHNYESSEIGDGIWKVVFNGIETVTQTDFDLSPNNTYNINMNSGAIVYYSDYPVYERIRDVQKIDIDWDDGSIKTMQTIKKQTYEFVYFTDDPETIITDVNSYNDVEYSSNTLTEIETSQEKIALNLFKVTINGVYNLDVDTLYTFPTSGTLLRITDETPTNYDYYTDYDMMLISEAAIKNTIKNQTGIDTTTKSITKEVKQVKFFMTESNAFDLKEKCELFKAGWSCDLAGSTVEEITNSDNIEPIKLGVNLYEINVNCLISVTAN